MYQKQFFQLILILLILQFSNSSLLAKTVIDCEYLAAVAEEKKDLPAGLLSSISNVEAGRIIGNNPKRGWPWTVNHAGEGLFFENKSEAIQYVKRYLKLGDLISYNIKLYEEQKVINENKNTEVEILSFLRERVKNIFKLPFISSDNLGRNSIGLGPKVSGYRSNLSKFKVLFLF